MAKQRFFRLNATIIGATIWWCGIALVRNGYNVLIDLITERDNRQRWRNRAMA